MLQVKWNTYPYRRELRWFWLVFSYEEKAYVWNKDSEELIQFCKDKWLVLIYFDEAIELDEAYIVKQKNIKAQQKAEKYKARAVGLEQQAEATTISQHERDFLVLWEPIKVGHHSESRHRKLIERSRRKMDKQHELYEKSSEAEGKADYRANKKFYTEDEKKQRKERAKQIREKAEEMWREKHHIGEEYVGWHTSWIIRKINKKTVNLVWWWMREIAYAKDFDLFLKQAQQCI